MKVLMSVCLVVIAACATAPRQAPELLLGVYAGEEQKAAFIPPRHARFPDGQEPGVTVWLTPEQAGRTATGETVSGFKFVSWRENEAVRVRVFALTNSRSYTKTASALKSVKIADYTVQAGSETAVAQMSELGVAPMTLRISEYAART